MKFIVTLTKPGKKPQIATVDEKDSFVLREKMEAYLKHIKMFRIAKLKIELENPGTQREVSPEKLEANKLGIKGREISKFAEMKINQEKIAERREKRKTEEWNKTFGDLENLFGE